MGTCISAYFYPGLTIGTVYLLYICLECQQVIVALVEGFPLIVDGIAEHTKGVDVTGLTATLREYVLRSQVVQAGVCVYVLTRIPLTKLK